MSFDLWTYPYMSIQPHWNYIIWTNYEHMLRRLNLCWHPCPGVWVVGQQRRSILSIYPFEMFFSVGWCMFNDVMSCCIWDVGIIFVTLFCSQIHFGECYDCWILTWSWFEFNSCIVVCRLCRFSMFLFDNLIIPLLLVKSQFWFDTPVYRNPTQDIQEVVMCGGSDVWFLICKMN